MDKKEIIASASLSELIEQEAIRRRNLLGEVAQLTDFDPSALRTRASAAYVSKKVMFDLWERYHSSGISGLRPSDWDYITVADLAQAQSRLHKLGRWADKSIITKVDLLSISESSGWTLRQTKRWLRRYRDAGIWGLIDGHDPAVKKISYLDALQAEDLGGLTNEDLIKIDERFESIKPFKGMEHVTKEEIDLRARETGICSRTLRESISLYKVCGLIGLRKRRREKSDPQSYRPQGIADDLIEVVKAIYLNNPGYSISKVFRETKKVALRTHLLEPTEHQVRKICASIPRADICVAFGLEDEFASSLKATRKYIRQEGIVYDAIDYHHVRPKVENLLRYFFPEMSKEIHPQLALIVEETSGMILAGRLSYDVADKHEPAALIREAYINYGAGDQLKFDNGKVNLSNHLKILLDEIHVEPHPIHPHSPTENGVVERTFETFEGEFFSEVKNLGRKLTMSDLDRHLQRSIVHYDDSVCKGDDLPRRELFAKLSRRQVDPRLLDTLLEEVQFCTVRKDGIHIGKSIYWWRDFGPFIGKKLLTRRPPSYKFPDSIEVFDNNHHVGTAFLIGGEGAQQQNSEDIRFAKAEQREAIHDRLEKSTMVWKTIKKILYELDEETVDEKDDHKQTKKNDGSQTTEEPPLINRL